MAHIAAGIVTAEKVPKRSHQRMEETDHSLIPLPPLEQLRAMSVSFQ